MNGSGEWRMVNVKFYVEGKKVHGVGYRAHLAMLALTSGIERVYAKNVTEDGKEKILVYAAAGDREKVSAFHGPVR